MSVLLEEPRPSPRGCVHPLTEFLGIEGTATFHRCTVCGGVVILQGGHCWILRSVLLP